MTPIISHHPIQQVAARSRNSQGGWIARIQRSMWGKVLLARLKFERELTLRNTETSCATVAVACVSTDRGLKHVDK